jgi:hypothetical protein
MRLVNLALVGLFTASLLAQAPKTDKKAPAPTADAKKAATPAASGFVGNKDSKIYHKAGCKTAAKMKAENKVPFASKAEAEKAGYKACKVCKADA